MLALDLLLTAEDKGGGTVAGAGAEQQHVLALMADAALGTALEIDSTAQNFIGTAGQHTGSVHLAQGIPAGVDGHVVEVQHVIAVAEVDGIEIVLALVVIQQRAGTAGDDGAAQLNADLLHAGGGALLNSNGIPAAGTVAQQLHLHQNYMRTLGGADAGQVGGDAALGIAAHDLHDGQAAARRRVDSQIGQRVGVVGVERRLKHDGRVGGAGHGQMVHKVGVLGQPGIGLGTHAAGGKISKVSLGRGGHTGRQGRGENLRLGPAVSGHSGQCRRCRRIIHAQRVPSGNRQAVHGCSHSNITLLAVVR